MTENRPSDRPIGHDPQRDAGRHDVPDDVLDTELVSRFHAAHPTFGDRATGPPEPPPRDVLLAIAGQSAEHAAEHLQLQAGELAQHLQAQERDVAHREAALNARYAAHDDERRSARLWLRERQEELAERAAKLERSQRTWEAEQRVQEQALDEQRRQLQAARADTKAIQEQLRHHIEAQQEVDAERQQLSSLRADLERLHAALRQRESALLHEGQRWELEKERWRERTQRQRQAIAHIWRCRGQSLQLQQRALRQRREQLDQRQQSLDQAQTDWQRTQHALLEQRLALELAHNGLATPLPPEGLAALRQAVRQFLADHALTLEAAQQRQRQELQTLAASLDHQQEALTLRHETLQRWIQDRQREFDEQAAHLETREQELEQLQQQLLHDKQTWLAALDDQLATTTTTNNMASCVEHRTPYA